jgi:microcystin-dependent protein
MYNAAGAAAAALAPAAVSPVGGGEPHNNMQPYLTLNFIIAMQGIFPARS